MLSPERDPPIKKEYHRSVSQFKTYVKCGEQFKLQRIVRPKLPERPASWLVLGQTFHDVYAQFELQDRQFDPIPYYNHAWEKWMGHFEEQQPDLSMWLKPPRSKIEKDLENRKNAGLKMVENYLEDALSGEWTVAEIDGVKGVELPFEVVFGQTKVVGYIDLLKKWKHSAYPTVTDLKTGNREVSTFQLETYHHALKKMGVESRYGEYWYAKDRVSSGFKASTVNDDTMDYYYDSLNTAIDQGIFLPNPGSHCGLCPVKKHCSLMGEQSED